MKTIKLNDILKNEKFEILKMEDSLEFFKEICEVKENLDFFPSVYNRLLKKVNLLNFEQKDIRKIKGNWKNQYNNWSFWFNEDGLYINIDGIPILKTIGKVHDYYKYEDILCNYSRNEFYKKNKEYELFQLSYAGIISREIQQWKTISYENLRFEKENLKQFSKSYKKFLNKHFKENLTETFGFIDKNGINTIGAKCEAYFDIELLNLQSASKDELVEILRIEETDAILGKKGILQLFGVKKFNNSNSWYEEELYKWHFTPQERVSKMKLIEANKDALTFIKEELQSDGVLNFKIETQPLSMQTIWDKRTEEGYAKALANYISSGYKEKAGIYENEEGRFYPLCQNAHHNVEQLLEWASEEEYRDDILLYISNSFSTQSFKYHPKDDEKFLMSINSEATRFIDNGEQKFAMCLGDVGSMSFAMDKKLFKDNSEIKITSFNSDCY